MKRALWSFGIALLSSLPLAAQSTGPAPVPPAPHETAAVLATPALEPFELQLPLPATHQVCSTVQTTPLRTAVGSTCAQAQSNLQAALLNDATCGECGFCSQSFIIKQCYVVAGGYQVSGYLRYTCVLCPL